MGSITTMTARQCRLQEWTEQIKSCKNRPQGTSVEEWCSLQGITKANYYYRLRRVRMACLQEISKNHSDSAQMMAQVPEHLLEKSMASSEIKPGTLTIRFVTAAFRLHRIPAWICSPPSFMWSVMLRCRWFFRSLYHDRIHRSSFRDWSPGSISGK